MTERRREEAASVVAHALAVGLARRHIAGRVAAWPAAEPLTVVKSAFCTTHPRASLRYSLIFCVSAACFSTTKKTGLADAAAFACRASVR